MSKLAIFDMEEGQISLSSLDLSLSFAYGSMLYVQSMWLRFSTYFVVSTQALTRNAS